MKQSQNRRSLKNTRRRRVYLVTASLTALVLAAGGTAMAVQSGSSPNSRTAAVTTDEVSTVAYGKRSAYPASDGPRKHWKKKYKNKRPAPRLPTPPHPASPRLAPAQDRRYLCSPFSYTFDQLCKWGTT